MVGPGEPPKVGVFSCARNGARKLIGVRFAGVFVAFRRAFLASALALGAMRVCLGMDGAGGCALAANVGAQLAEIAMVDRTSRQDIHRRRTDICAIEVDQCTLCRPFADVRRCAGLRCVDCFLARFDA